MEVRQITPTDTHRLRHLVLWPHIDQENKCVIDIDNRSDAIHLGTFSENKLVAIGSFFQMNSPKLSEQNQYRLRAMASAPVARGTGAGKLLVAKGIQILKEKKISVLWCDARLNATGFYSALGFHKLEEIYEVPLIGPHQFMWIELQSSGTGV
ncbi:MAG: GNAT family N-acetyltransferase [Flavobacteriales bacterium]|nr:GNAT family N-acetyltransferase [Flavobacteriales bacterium]